MTTLADFASKPTVKAKKSQRDISKLTGFLESVNEAGLRVSYSGLLHVAAHVGLVNTTRFIPVVFSLINQLPIELQPLVCNKNGEYKEGAIAKWAEHVPDGLDDRKVIDGEAAVEAYTSLSE